MTNKFKEIYNSIIFESKTKNDEEQNLNENEKDTKKENKVIKEKKKSSVKKTNNDEVDNSEENLNTATKEKKNKNNFSFTKKSNNTNTNTPKKSDKLFDNEKDFITKFIRYNELQILKNELPKITDDLKAVEGFDTSLLNDSIQETLDERQAELDSLTNELTTLRNIINQEAEAINYKKSIIDLFDKQAVNQNNTCNCDPADPTCTCNQPEQNSKEDQNIYGYNQPNTNTEKLNFNKSSKIDDLQQAEQFSADALEPDTSNTNCPDCTYPNNMQQQKINKRKPILIDSNRCK